MQLDFMVFYSYKNKKNRTLLLNIYSLKIIAIPDTVKKIQLQHINCLK